MDDTERAGLNVERAAQPHFDRFVGPRNFPWVRPGEPVIGLLALPAVVHRLLEDAVFVAQAGTDPRNAQRGHRIEETGSQPAQSTVAQASVRLLFDDLQRIDPVALTELAKDRVEHQVGNVIGQGAAHEELQGEIINPLGVAFPVGLLRLEPTLREHVANRMGDRFELVVRRRSGHRHDMVEGEMAFVERVVAAGECHRAAVITSEQLCLLLGDGFG
jgi:hypothetical protein